jgi:hypothetical protein
MNAPRPASGLVEIIRKALAASTQVADVISIPTLLIDLPHGKQMYGKIPAADLAIDQFREHGFAADRTKMNLDGYPGLLRSLSEPAPWIEIEPDDVFGEVSEGRAFELRPLVERANSEETKKLFDERRAANKARNLYWKELFGRERSSLGDVFAEEMFGELLALGKSIGCQDFEGVWDAVFEYDEFSVGPGAPDLLVWLLDSECPLWFFTEVKGPGDSLRKSQKDWIHQNWSAVGGHFLITNLWY